MRKNSKCHPPQEWYGHSVLLWYGQCVIFLDFLRHRIMKQRMLLRHPHQTQIRYSIKEISVLKLRCCAIGSKRKTTHSKAHTKSDSLLRTGEFAIP
ncbi:hypothetical protein NPIL_87281 [Nephila pilipes]|uniref:Uncharacterized protein n=1 Tax=Nephila pilipes TaxID=299642 RepID=A0A8X6Q770_NEPPI|nr:hypothetical protein NPIL_87281 [Nephila pilipes]